MCTRSRGSPLPPSLRPPPSRPARVRSRTGRVRRRASADHSPENLQRHLQRRLAAPGTCWHLLAILAGARVSGTSLAPLARRCQEVPVDARRCGCSGTPDRIRTCGLRLRRPPLYPAELRAQWGGRILAAGAAGSDRQLRSDARRGPASPWEGDLGPSGRIPGCLDRSSGSDLGLAPFPGHGRGGFEA